MMRRAFIGLLFASLASAACSTTLQPWATCNRSPDCCTAGYKCYEADASFAQCRTSCSISGWTCKVLGESAAAASSTKSCSQYASCAADTNCCQEGLSCYRMNPWYAQCRRKGDCPNGWTCTDTDTAATSAPPTSKTPSPEASTPDTPSPSPSPTPTPAPKTPPTPASSKRCAEFAACTTDETCCQEGLTCQRKNRWYAQCVKGAATISATPTPPTPTLKTPTPTPTPKTPTPPTPTPKTPTPPTPKTPTPTPAPPTDSAQPSWVKDLVTGCNGETSGLTASTIYYTSPSGSSSASGTSFSSALDLSTALAKAKAGSMVLLEPGTYKVQYTEGAKNTITLSRTGTSSNRIYVVAANCGRAVIDWQFPEQAWVQNSFGFALKGSYYYFKNIDITRTGYQGVYVTGSHNTFENCRFHNNRNTGLEINKGGEYTTVINCDAYMNYDPKKDGSMADGFGPKQKQGPGNKFYGCRSWYNSDDGYDMYDSTEAVEIYNSWAFRNGVDVWNYGGFSGNGNGFKLGGKHAVAFNKIYSSVAFENPVKGFDQNNNEGGLTVVNGMSYNNGINYGLGSSVKEGQHHIRNCISLKGSQTVTSADVNSDADSKYNSWDTVASAKDSDFASLDVTLAFNDRSSDGTIPSTALFRLSSGSHFIDAGANAGLPYNGNAPDLGAFETA